MNDINAKTLPAALFAAGVAAPPEEVYGSALHYYREGVLPVTHVEVLVRRSLQRG